MEEDQENYGLPPEIKRMVMGFGQAKRSELSRSNISLTSLSSEPLISVPPMGSNWTEAEDFVLFRGSKQGDKNWEQIASGLPKRTPEQCRLRWNYISNPLRSKNNNTIYNAQETPTKPSVPSEVGKNLSPVHTSMNFDFLQSAENENPFQDNMNVFSQHPPLGSAQESTPNAYFIQLFNDNNLMSLSNLTPVTMGNDFYTPQISNSMNYTDISRFQNTPLFESLNFPITTPCPVPQLGSDFLTPGNAAEESATPRLLAENSNTKRLKPITDPKPKAKEITTDSAKEQILEIASLLRENPQLIPVIEKLSKITTHLPKGANTDQIIDEIDFPNLGHAKRLSSAQNTPEVSSYPNRRRKRPSARRYESPNDEEYGGESLLYRFATQDFPDELEGDHDFVNNDHEHEADYGDTPVVTKKELAELFEQSESSEEEEVEQKKQRIKPEEYQKESPLFSKDVLSRIRSQQQQNLQLVLQAYAIECRFRGAKSEKALYWKSRALYIKKLDQLGRTLTSTPLDDAALDTEDNTSYISFFVVPGSDYMDAMLDVLANPPDSIMSSSVVPGSLPVKAKIAGLTMKKRDWEVYYPEKDFIAPNSPKNVVDKARCISILIDEIFLPIFTKALKPFFAIIKKRDRPIFTPAEDKLFTIGLYKFGDDWASIRSHLLPPRSSRQLENRFNNLKSRRAQFTPIQQYYLRQIKPLTLKEEELLTQGVRCYGRKFRVISQRMIPNRPSFVLKKAFREMELRKIALNKPVFLDSYN